ncbi:RICIN domain-containing protein [Oligoflexus sp.]|uniref:RICIN domain-containing protein n=1 Tax=Oligoflexus sp. TaxID=1971216 RepID=UPI0039C9744C
MQPCDPNAVGQKFLFARSLDGRVQLKDTSSQRCLQVGPIGFFVTVLRAEVCESKSSQFFSVVDYGATYSLKFDGNNTCIDAELSRATPGTRLILWRCSAVLNQKIQVMKI